MYTMVELLENEIPYLTINDMTEIDWHALDFALEEFDRSNESYDPRSCRVLRFVLEQIRCDIQNFMHVPPYIRNAPKFQEIAALYNPQLSRILFPTRNS